MTTATNSVSCKKWYPTFDEYLRAEYAGPFPATDILIRYDLAERGEGLVLIYRKILYRVIKMHGVNFYQEVK